MSKHKKPKDNSLQYTGNNAVDIMKFFDAYHFECTTEGIKLYKGERKFFNWELLPSLIIKIGQTLIKENDEFVVEDK